MNKAPRLPLMPPVLLLLLALPPASSAAAPDPDAEARLGAMLFFDARLSQPEGQSCASCHSPQTGFADPRRAFPTSEGAQTGRFGPRNAPTLTYAATVPALHLDPDEGIYVGGLFWDGRADTLESQAIGPLFHPLEMGIPDAESLLTRLRALGYAADFERVYGAGAVATGEAALQSVTRALAAYQRTAELSPYTSKYDYYLRGQAELTAQELRGLRLFDAEDKGNCAACHPSTRQDDGSPPLFTDFTYDNLGVPRNTASGFLRQAAAHNPAGADYRDIGLAATTGRAEDEGKFRVSTLRNIELTAPYMHNGIFDTLEEAVRFYNARDVSDEWGAPEISANVNTEELGNLGLTEDEVADIVAFMKTLTDGYNPPAP